MYFYLHLSMCLFKFQLSISYGCTPARSVFNFLRAIEWLLATCMLVGQRNECITVIKGTC